MSQTSQLIENNAAKKIKLRLIIMIFLQYFVWGAWLITIANYWFSTKIFNVFLRYSF